MARHSGFLRNPSLEHIFIDFRKRGSGRERERNTDVREINNNWVVPRTRPYQGRVGLTTSVRALARNITRNLLVRRTSLQPTELPSQGHHSGFLKKSLPEIKLKIHQGQFKGLTDNKGENLNANVMR